MTLTELRYIVAVAQHHHFGRAAEACFVSQPTLSVAIKKLEDELGIALFERRKQEIVVTPAGERIIAQARRVLDEAATIKTIASGEKDQLHEPLRVGAIYTIGPYLFPHLIPELHQRAPNMPLQIEENYTALLTERLRQGELDAILIALPFEEPGIVTLPLYDEPFVIVIPSGHPLQEQDEIPADELTDDHLLLLGRGHCFRNQVLQACPKCVGSSESTLAKAVDGTSLETIRHMVASGLGITVLPCSAAGASQYAQRLLKIRRFAEPVPRRRVALAWRTSFPRPKAIEALRQALLGSLLSCVTPIEG